MVTISVVVQLESMAQSFLLRVGMTKESERNQIKHKAIVGREHNVYFDCFCASPVLCVDTVQRL